MKNCILLSLYLAALYGADAQTRQVPHEWTATLMVVDDSGVPVSNALVWVSYNIPSTPERTSEWEQIKGLSDSHGLFQAFHRDQSVTLGFHAEKAGYYSTGVQHFLGFEALSSSANWSPTQTLVLVRVGSPISLYVKRAEAKFSMENEALGFDLMVGDWVAPYGTGKQPDMLFTASRKVKSENEYSGELQLTFPNAGDGINSIAESTGGPLLRTAPEAGYEPTRSWHYSQAETPPPVRGYFFRVRTMTDDKGEVKSALYGKVIGDIRFYVGTKAPHPGMAFTYYLNPTPNDHNLEFDPKRNLMKNHGPGESVAEP